MTFSVSNDRLESQSVTVQHLNTPNQGGRIRPSFIVLHDTCGYGHGRGSTSWFMNASARVSAHILIAEDGAVTQFADFDRATWHAGRSSWRGVTGLNGHAIGIEMANPGKCYKRGSTYIAASRGNPVDGDVTYHPETDWHPGAYWKPYTEAQLETLKGIVKALHEAYPTIAEVIGHHHIAPGRKIDPSPLMPWPDIDAAFQSATVKPPAPDVVGIQPPASLARADIRAMQKRLNDLGYAAGETKTGIIGSMTKAAVYRFQIENGLKGTGTVTRGVLDKIMADGAKPAPLAARQGVTDAEMSEISRTHKAGDAVNKTGWLSVITGGGIAAVTATVQTFNSFAASVQEMLNSVGLVGVGLIAATAFAIWGAVQVDLGAWIKWFRTEDHKEGANVH